MLLFTLWYPLTKAMGNDLNGDRGVFHADGKSSSNRAGKKCPRLGCRALPTVLGGRAGKTVEGFLHSYCAGTRYPMMLHKAPRVVTELEYRAVGCRSRFDPNSPGQCSDKIAATLLNHRYGN